jgi:hypothetical protein
VQEVDHLDVVAVLDVLTKASWLQRPKQSTLLVHRKQHHRSQLLGPESLPPVFSETFRSLCPEIAKFYQAYQVAVCAMSRTHMFDSWALIVAIDVSRNGRIVGKSNKRYSALKFDLYH